MVTKIVNRDLSRRKFFLIGGIAASALFINKIAWAESQFTLSQPKDYGQKRAHLSDTEFLLLSKLLMHEDSLDIEMSKKIYLFLKKYKAEIYLLYEYIRSHSPLDNQSFKKYLLSNKKILMTYSNIMKAWYSGVLKIGKSAMRFTYFDSYMFRLMAGLAPTPGICGGQTNYWSEKPNV
ncbi:sugar dehydrogenase complex small subunit [Fluviispira vulneris]|uniref:sugar dehydrogenase complex small subunit n=1 Tax=Fluviispira vulneris TaxID=2763012 RepID=UPI0016487854|nr:sugar dehydrogenase complex small subunit [Fluviispira vulneris]